MTDRSHLSIGEVLTLLQADFPDVTISKIRFLESQGLLDPERSPSGYRKFFDADIERLKWILRQQRENFLPLKVIKDRLASGDVDFDIDLVAEEKSEDEYGASSAGPVRASGTSPLAGVRGTDSLPVDPSRLSESASRRAETKRHAASSPRRSSGGPGHLAPGPERSSPEADHPEPPAAPLFDTGETAISLTLEELMGATGLSAREIGELQRFGMLSSRSLGNTSYYDEDALLVARLAARFRSHGVEARHLRMYRVAAEREAGVFEQLLMPMLRRRNPQARRETTQLVNELAALGDGLRSAMLRQLLREYLDGA